MVTEINWGEPIENFPTGGWDNFDGTIELIEYETGTFNTQIHIVLSPESYEYEKRGMSYDPDTPATLNAWYSMGGNTESYDVSLDGLTAVGPQPNRNTRAVKLMLGVREHTGKSTNGSDLSPLKGVMCHWKGLIEKNRNPTNNQQVERTTLYPVSPPLGASGGSVVSDSDMQEAYDLIKSILTLKDDTKIRTRNVAQEAIAFESQFGADIVALASKEETINSAIRAGVIVREDERTIALA
jgi:hypothetical protein